ncbi:DUF1540 domain-containing protein [Cellulosilyticum lentocellum]|uniref:DUF1540 domain-containing protein n=1 Tax=Cellulosilyticum lentocellum (strain ATCC 49066 / DSM 5427 / NCIMB 11756 / RHM5) TaxID=642492 RepID=F2JN17_CELLD|nr:DUF1540 domain-containing protein [Cellulosilyticum lentocellum]ADZ82359.1 protein of unknown function DUF1540 [Cellulosilyticum lentocellum DSM 5427]
MPKIHCGVDTCSYNQDKVCRASIINVGGKGSTDNESTCCGSFLNRLGYSNLAQYTENRGDTDAILCKVDTCIHNSSEHCSLNELQIGPSKEEAEIYTETDCLSFERR